MKIRKQTALWVTKSGERIRICDMSDEHLQNTMKMLERVAKGRCASYQLMPCPFTGGTVAEDDFECSQLTATIEDFLPEIYDKMLLDYERRLLR